MADKQCFVYIIDQGKSMGEHNSGRAESDLEFGTRYIYDKIAVTMAAARKTWTVGVLGVRTDGSENALAASDEAYENISVQKEIGPVYLNEFRQLKGQVCVSGTNKGDVISSIVLAIEMIGTYTKRNKWNRKIVVMTNARGFMDADDLDEIANKLNQESIELVIVGVDFDDAEYGFKEEDKDPRKSSNEALLKTLVEKCEAGTFGTVAEAVEGLAVPVVKSSRPYKTYVGPLTLGDPQKYESAMSIDVERYFRTHKAAAISASNFITRSDFTNDEAAQAARSLKAEDDGDMEGIAEFRTDLAAVKQLRTYKVNDPSAPGGKKDVERDDLAKGYEYGRTAVHISESDENVTKLETISQLTIIGFIPQEKHQRFFNMGESCVTIAQVISDKARMAFSSLVHALHELDTCAVARLVKKDGNEPQLILMFPSIEPDLECLIDIPLPFAEDVRTYRFPPLDRVVTISGSVLTKHRNIPTETLSDAMSNYVDSMDLSDFGKDDEGNPTEYMPIEETYAPTIHRISQAVRRRAIRPGEPVAPPAEILTRFSHPPKQLVEASTSQLNKLIEAADVKKVPPKVKGKRGREYIKPLSGLDIDALLASPAQKRSKLSANNAIPEYRQLLNGEDIDSPVEISKRVKEATEQMAKITRSLISGSTGSNDYSRALSHIEVMRSELLLVEEPALYNAFVQDLKKQVLAGELGGDRREFFFEIRRDRLGLITQEQCEVSEATEEQAKEFYRVSSSLALR